MTEPLTRMDVYWIALAVCFGYNIIRSTVQIIRRELRKR